MSTKRQVKAAARKVRKTRNATNKKQKQPSIWTTIWNALCWPFHKIAKLFNKLWNWICGINFIGLLNTTLLISIIALFSMLIIDFTKCNKQPVIIISQPAPVTETRKVIPRKSTLPISEKKITEPINVLPVKKSEVKISKKQTAFQNRKILGDIIVDNRGAGALLQYNNQVDGNLYLQNMHKYTLPCGTKIHGNMFLRNIGLLQFCGDFTVTGNIYVSPNSSFGPLPKTARIGGHVIL
jgi:hypothetical protein